MFRAIQLATLLLPLASVLALPTTHDATSDLQLVSLGFVGSGCPPESVHILPDGKDLVGFDAFSLAHILDYHKYCQMSLAFDLPAGKQITIGKVEYEGYLSMADGINVYLDTSTYYSLSEEVESKYTIKGPKYGPFDYEATFSEKLWSQCGPTVVQVHFLLAMYIHRHESYVGWGNSSVESVNIGNLEIRSC